MLFENRLLFIVIISRCDGIVQWIKTIYKGGKRRVYYETVWPKFWVDACCAVWCFKSSSNSLCLFILLFLYIYIIIFCSPKDCRWWVRKTERRTDRRSLKPSVRLLFAPSSRLAGNTFSLELSSADRRMQLMRFMWNNLEKQTLLFFFSPLMLWFLISVKMHGICYCTKIEEVNM